MKPIMTSRHHNRGFTLIEILVALAVLAIALAALVKAAGDSASSTAYLRDKTLAQWVALNKAAEYRLGLDGATDTDGSGHERFADHDWYWSARLKDTDDRYVRRLEVEVRARRDAPDPLVTVITFLPGGQGG